MTTPIIRRDEKGILTLYVKNRPFFIYGGEIHNSSASDSEYMEREVWPAVEGLHMNTILAPVYWELLEEKEGVYDFSSVDSLINQARAHHMHLVLLWFGLWKNAESMYIPGWMKKDTQKYFRVEKKSGEKIPVVSPFCKEAIEKDRSCFQALMKYLRSIDEEKNTVVMMQVENEVGILGDARDYCAAANEAFEKQIPSELSDVTGEKGTWREVFEEGAEEAFMAWSFGRAVGEIASSGKEIYPLPCYVNAWLKQYPWYPGSYPSGGPVISMQQIWKTAAPELDLFAPDIYVPYCADIMDAYQTEKNPLFVPEIRKDAVTASYCMYAFGSKYAIGYSPFGIEELTKDPNAVDRPPLEVMRALNIDPTAFEIEGSAEILSETYKILKEMEPLLLQLRGTVHLNSFVRHGENDFGTFVRFSRYNMQVAYEPRSGGNPLGAGIIMELSENEFLLTGTMCRISFLSKPDDAEKTEILRLEEGNIIDGHFERKRVLNGDEKMSVRFGRIPETYRVVLYRY